MRQLKKNGFSLVEVLLYVAIFSVVIGAYGALLSAISVTKNKTRVVLEVEQQGELVSGFFAQTLRGAQSVNVPSQGNSSTQLSLAMPSPAPSPAVFSLSSGRVAFTEGGGGAEYLTSTKLTVSDLSFSNIAKSGELGLIKFQFTITSSIGAKKEYSYAKTFTGATQIRAY